MTDEIEIPDPLGEVNKPKTSEPAPGFDATVIEPALPKEVVPEVSRVVPVEPVTVEPVVVDVAPAAVEVPQFTETPKVPAFTPPAGNSPKKNNTVWWVVGIIVLLLLCCCCSFVAVLWFLGDEIVQAIETSVVPVALALLS